MRLLVCALALGFAVGGSTAAWSGMNYRCLTACQQAGYKHPYCTARCATAPPSAPAAFPAKHGTDYRCVDRCTGSGHPRALCLKNCSF